MNSRRNRIISGFLAFIMVMIMVLEILPPIEVYATTGQVTIISPDNKEEFQVGEEISVSWERTPANASYYQFVVKQLYGTPSYNVGTDEPGKTIINKKVSEKGSVQYVSTSFDTTDYECDCWYKIYVKGFNSDDSVCSEADAVWIYLVTEDQEILNAEFHDGSTKLKISGDGYNETKNVAQIYIDASTNWTASVNEDWVTLSRYKGTSSNNSTLVYSEHNDSLKERTAYITITCGELEIELRLIQSGRELTADELCESDADDLEIDYASGDSEDSVTKDIGLPTGGLPNGSSVTWESSNEDIITADGQVIRPIEDTEVVLTATLKNYADDTYGSYTKKFYLTVLGMETVQDTISINPNWEELTADVFGGTGTTFTVTSSSKWSVEANVNWISFNRSTGNSGSSFTPSIGANAGKYREGIITVTCGDASVEICVKQEGTTTEPEKVPCVTSLTVSPTEGTLKTTYTFTATAENTDTVVFYVSGHKIGEVASTNGTFKCTYDKFTNGGDCVVYAYPCDEYGNEVKTSGSYKTEEFTITVEGTLSPVKISTDSYQSIDVNTSFTVEWTDTASVPDDVSYNIYVWYDNKQVGDVMNTSSHSKTIPSSYFSKEGRYIIGIYAISDTWTASSGVSIAVNVTVDTPYIDNFSIAPNTVSLGGSVKLAGMVYGNGSDIAEIIIKITNNSDGTGGVYKTLYPNSYKLNMADTPAINTSDAIFTTPGTYSVKLYALNEGAVNEVLLGQKTLQVIADSKITLNTPVLGGASTISYGDDYTVSWNYDGSVDYYLIGISGLTYSKTVDASNSSYTIPFSVFRQYLGSSGSNFTVYVTAMSNSDTYLPSAKESKTVYVSGDASEKAVIKSVTLPGRDHNEVTAGETVTFEVVTSTDVEAIRMKDGAGTFIVNTWNSGYTDSGSNRTWTVKQKVSYAGSSDVDYVNRSLTFYSMIGNTEYNKCNVTFICVKDAVVGAFDITKPVNGSEQQPEKSLTITWTTPDTGVDYYVVDITHNGVRIDEDVFPYEVRNGNSYTLDGSYLIRDNNAWNVQVTGCKAGMADTSDSVRFVLKCQHEKLGTAVEKYLSYTNTGSSSTHSVKTEKTYPCLECGMTNAKTETGTKAVNHNYITLDEGGKVCNQCWYVNSNGSYDVQYDMDLVTTNSNGRENVYANVGADGNPVNVQSNRYVEVGDSITVWGVLGNSYLIEYPTSSGTHKGFIKIECIDLIESDEVVNKTYNQLLAENYIDAAFGGGKNRSIDSKYIKIYENEYMVSRLIAEKEIEQSDTYVYSLLQNANSSFWDNALHSYIEYFGSDADMNEWAKTLCYEFLYSCIIEIPNENEVDAEVFDSVDMLWDFLETKTGVKDLRDLDTDSLATLSVDKDSLNKIMSLGSDTPVIAEALNTTNNILKETGGKCLDTAIQSGVNALIYYYKYLILQTAADIEIFDLLIDIYGDDPAAKAAILELKSDYQYAGLNVLMEVAKDVQNLGKDIIIENGLVTIPGGTFVLKVKVAIDVIDFIRALFMHMSGLSALAEGSLNLVLMYDFLLTAKMHMRNLINEYEASGRTDIESANEIVLLYDFIRGCQIFINRCAIDVSNDNNEDNIMLNEIKHIKESSIDNWKLNPYYTTSIDKVPSYDKLDYPYKVLLDGYSNNYSDGLLGGWDSMEAYERKIAYNTVERLIKFSESQVNEMYVINFDSDSIDDFHLSILFVNKDGMGLLFTGYDFWAESAKYGNATKLFYVFNKSEVTELLSGKASLPSALCCTAYRSVVETSYFNYFEGGVFIYDGEVTVKSYMKKLVSHNQYYDYIIEEHAKNEVDMIGILTAYGNLAYYSSSKDLRTEIKAICDKTFGKPLGYWTETTVESIAEVLNEKVVYNN